MLRDVREWMFRAIMFEAEAEAFRSAGIRIGADLHDSERSLLDDALSPFGVKLRNDALRMTRLYAILYAFENTVRSLIKERLEERHGVDWWNQKVPSAVKKFAAARLEDAEKNSWLEGERSEPIAFVDFGHLADIIANNWDDFMDLIPTQHWLRQRMDELEKARNFVAHHRMLLPSEFQRIEMYVGDWNRIVGL